MVKAMAKEPREAIEAIEAEILVALKDDLYEHVRTLAEARAWLVYPNQAHGGQAES